MEQLSPLRPAFDMPSVEMIVYSLLLFPGQFLLPQVLRGSQGDDSSFISHGAVKVINDALVTNHPGLMSVDIVPGFGWLHQVGPFPPGPVHQVVRAGERIERLRLPAGAEVEHDPDVTDFDDLRIAAYAALLFFAVCDDGFFAVAAPVNHVDGDRHTDSFVAVLVLSVLEHDKPIAQRLGFVPDDIALVQRLSLEITHVRLLRR